MPVQRIVPNLLTNRISESRRFYLDLLGLELGMDLGFITTLVSREDHNVQISLLKKESGAAIQPAVSIEVDNVDLVYRRAQERELKIVYPLIDEPWGVRRFFVADPDGTILNILSHRPQVAKP